MDKQELINKFLGHPFQEGIFDCFDLVIQWYKELGIIVPDFKHEIYWDGKPINLETYFKKWKRIEKKEIQLNDVVWFKPLFPFSSSRTKYHMGIYLGEGLFIQCRTKEGVVISRVNKFERFIDGFYRFMELDCD